MAISTEAQEERAHLNALLDPLDTVKATDPGLVLIAEGDIRVPNAAPTSDPHRITFLVPTPEDVVFSMGAAGPTERIADIGITGRTKHHIHWVTTTDEPETAASGGAPASSGASQTLISLGGPALSAKTASHGGVVGATLATGAGGVEDGAGGPGGTSVPPHAARSRVRVRVRPRARPARTWGRRRMGRRLYL